MKTPVLYQQQRGAILVVGLIMLVLITLMVTTAFTLGTSNLRSVGNMQSREETIAAANAAIEIVLPTVGITTTSQEIDVDINLDGTVDYTVTVAAPVCIRAIVDPTSKAGASSVTLGGGMTIEGMYIATLNLKATVNDTVTGAKAIVNVGTRAQLTPAQKNLMCPEPI